MARHPPQETGRARLSKMGVNKNTLPQWIVAAQKNRCPPLVNKELKSAL
jgi:hypothetical protein